MKPTPEQIDQMAIDVGALKNEMTPDGDENTCFSPEILQAFFTLAYKLGWKNRGESDAKICDDKGLVMGNGVADICAEAIRNNTGE